MTAAADPTLSICILSWNTRQLLADCLNSIYADADAVSWQVIVVDNDSQDDSADRVAADFPQVELIRSEHNLGFAGGNNLALTRATAPVFLLLNSDTRVHAGALGRMLETLGTDERIGAVGPWLENGEGALELSCGRDPGLGAEIVHKLLLHRVFPYFKFGRWDHRERRNVGWVTGACFMVRRAAVEQVGGLDDRIFMCFEDLEWCMRLRAAGWQIVYEPAGTVIHLEGRSISQRFGEMLVVSQQSLFYLFDKHFGPLRLHTLRLLTLIEMVLRSSLWSLVWIFRPGSRVESRQRLGAYCTIFRRTLTDRTYWSPARSN
ncbi:MAG: glycosyltransferase family 2 protein [Gemmatimonadetes bacterium]|nr:glycosyltransferase family 2 protein [Gemmatimonadota bacterium]